MSGNNQNVRRKFIPFSKWNPDGGLVSNPGMLDVTNVVPYRGMYVPVAEFDEVSGSTQKDGEDILGSHVHLQDDNMLGWKVYAGDSEDLFEVDPDGGAPWAVTEVSKVGGYTNVGDEGWFFTSFGQHVIACAGHSVVPQIRLAGSGGTMAADFADLYSSSDYEPKPKFCAALGSRVVLANCADVGSASDFDPDPNIVFVSKTDNARAYSDPIDSPGDRTDFYLLYDDLGPITGLAGGREFGFVFKERGIYRIEYQGAYGLEFIPVSFSIGTIYPHSLIWVDQELYFMGPRGPAKVVYDRVVEINSGIQRTLFDDWIEQDITWQMSFSSTGVGGCSACYDKATDCIIWEYKASQSRALVLSIRDEWCSVWNWSRGIQFGVTLPDRNDAFLGPRDVAFWAQAEDGQDIVSLLIKTSTTGNSEGNANAFRTPFLQLAEEGITRVIGIRPIITLRDGETAYPKMALRVFTRTAPWVAVPENISDDTDTAGQPDARGFVTLPDAKWGELHSLQLLLDSGDDNPPAEHLADVKGLEVEYQMQSGRPSQRGT